MRLPCLLVLMICAHHVPAQGPGDDVRPKEWADSTLSKLRASLARDPARTLSLTDSLLRTYVAGGDLCALAEVSGFRSTSFSELGVFDSAMVCAHRVFQYFPADCDSAVLLRGQVALSKLYLSLGEFRMVDSISNAGLAWWRAHWTATVLRNALLTNQAIARASTGDLEGAEGSFRRILGYATKEGIAQDIDDANTNLGAVKRLRGQLDSASYYYDMALANARRSGKYARMAVHFSNLADLAERRFQVRHALVLLDSALKYAVIANDLPQQVRIHTGMAHDHAELGNHRAAFKHALIRYDLQDSLMRLEKVKSMAEMQERYESEKKARTIKELEVDKLAGELRRESLERTRNIYLFSGLGVLLMAGGLWSRLRFIRRSRAAIQREKDISEGLLLNILPGEVAEELKRKGEAEARLIDQVTVLFTDFKGFTAMSEQLSPKELVRDIHECFSAFDHIMEKHGIEKIKTIGDAYMAAGGLPVPNATHARDVVLAALEVQAFIAEGKARKIAAGLPFFEIRIGVHTGPVVAGIVGVKKFQYDIWGDTVNTASRMESSGEVGEVNISEATYALIKDEPGLAFTARGKVQAKGKGEMEMFFVRRSNDTA